MSDRGYVSNLRQLAAGLALHAAEARRRGIYVLEYTLTDAAASAAEWANSLEEGGHADDA